MLWHQCVTGKQPDCGDGTRLSMEPTPAPKSRPPSRKQRKRPPVTATRQEAIAQGLDRYLGKPCKHGHNGERYTLGECVQCSDNRNDARRIEYKLDSPNIPPARLAAYRLGHRYYTPSEPCANGHNAPRNTTYNYCLQCDKESSMRASKRNQAREATSNA